MPTEISVITVADCDDYIMDLRNLIICIYSDKGFAFCFKISDKLNVVLQISKG